MATSPGTVELVALALGQALAPLKDRLAAGQVLDLFAELGVRFPSGLSAQANLANALQNSVDAANQLPLLVTHLTTAVEAQDKVKIITAATALINAIKNLVDGLDAAALELPAAAGAVGFNAADAVAFAGSLVESLFGYLFVRFLEGYAPFTLNFLSLAGLVDRVLVPVGGPTKPGHTDRLLRFDRVNDLINSPDTLLKSLYGWGNPGFDGKEMLRRIRDLINATSLPVHLDTTTALPVLTLLPLTITPKTDINPPGLRFDINGDFPFIGTVQLPLSGSGLSIEVVFDSDVKVGTIAAFTPPANIEFTPPSGPFQGRLVISIIKAASGSDPFVVLGATGSSGIFAKTVKFSVGTSLQWDSVTNSARGDFQVEFNVNQGQIIVDLADADSFVGSIMPGNGIQFDFDFGVGWSAHQGVFFTGSTAIEFNIPLHINLGPINLDILHLLIRPQSGGLALDIMLTSNGTLGPLVASVDRIGLTADLKFHRGNLGPADLSFAFKPPNGVGLSLDTGIIKGGGFLYIDTDRGEYAGALELVFADFLNLHAIGLINTKMPDGSNGFSLLIIITADFGPSGIQLGFGFTLLAVGGLLGLNRTMLFQPLMDGVRTNSIESIMFPHDIIANAPRIISDLRAIFPPHEGTFLIGPMAKLGWGEPKLVSLSLGVIIEIPPGDIAILGILKVALPADELAILVLQVNFVGALEFDKQRLYFFASLFDSHILFITIEGEMGVLFAYGHDANFVLSIGGFHPQFNPPPLPFPTPRRIQIDIINESYARIRCDGYFAVTTNTVQFGSHSEYFFGFDALSVEGHSGFDALIQFSPFHFIVEISTSFSVKVFGLGVYGIDIDLYLAGPNPFHAHGTASISFLFFSIGIGIDFTWGDSRDTTLPPIVVMPVLTAELGKQSNWRALLPNGSNLLVSLRQLDPAEAAFVLHPVGTLHVSQRLIPLDLTLDKVGNQQPTDANRFSLSVSSADLVKKNDVNESFPPSQFKNFDDAAKLSQPAYQDQHGGLELSAAGNVYASATAITREVRYHLTIIDTTLQRKRFYLFLGSLFSHLLGGASVTLNVFSAHRQAQMQPFAEKVAVNTETFAVAFQADNTVYHPEAAAFSSQASAHDYLTRTVASNPALSGSLHVLPQFEVAA